MFGFRFLWRTEENVEVEEVLEGLQSKLRSGNSEAMRNLPLSGHRRSGWIGSPQHIRQVA
jgi:hypothetical protein